ncbi:MAG: acyl-CoA synthetase (AMP-forming)/AMP-acid ligase [Ilumatobacteraceae bacterium]|nr:acyl-CoA synthetase (AMP-forming)/AMP-acid ligase [Ilumatobacteraceae bacterium]
MIEGHPAERVAVISRNRATTYGSLREQVADVRARLTGLGITDGDTVGLLIGNNRHFVVSYLAVLGIGAVAVPLNPTSPANEIERELKVVGAVAVVIGPTAVPSWRNVERTEVPALRHALLCEGELSGTTLIDDLPLGEPVPVADVADDHLAVLIFTSGTAGSPRAAMLTHGNLRANIAQANEENETGAGDMNPDDVVFGVLPMFHIFGLNVVLGITLSVGATVVMLQRFDPSTALETIVKWGITVVPGAPPMWIAFSTFDDAPRDAFATVRNASTGAAKMPEEATRRLQERFGIELAEGYGLTEASPIVTSSRGVPVRIGSVGKVLDGVDVRLVDESGDDVLAGDAGEIWVRGPNVFPGYLDDPESTARVLTPDGWLRTGDIAITDADGYLYLIDRAKDLIIVSGFNVYPKEVEDVLMEYPGVAEVGVVGVPHPHTGEAVKAFVVAADGVHLDEDALIDHCMDELARYKCPSKILFVDQLPRNVSGKLLRRELI